jgi:hypothetical protein
MSMGGLVWRGVVGRGWSDVKAIGAVAAGARGKDGRRWVQGAVEYLFCSVRMLRFCSDGLSGLEG